MYEIFGARSQGVQFFRKRSFRSLSGVCDSLWEKIRARQRDKWSTPNGGFFPASQAQKLFDRPLLIRNRNNTLDNPRRYGSLRLSTGIPPDGRNREVEERYGITYLGTKRTEAKPFESNFTHRNKTYAREKRVQAAPRADTGRFEHGIPPHQRRLGP